MSTRWARLGIAGFALTGLFAIAPATAGATGARLDPSFATDGVYVHSQEDGYSSPAGLVVQPDGALVTTVLGSERREFFQDAFGFTQAGRLDPSFGPNGDGRVEIPAALGEHSSAVGLPDGKILIGWIGRDPGAYSQPPSLRFGRLLADGTLDAGFGAGGTLDTGIETDSGLHIGVGSDGRIVTASMAPNPSPGTAYEVAALIARFHPDGSLDGSFGAEGLVKVTDPAASGTSAGPLVVEPGGGIVVAGGTSDETYISRTVLFRLAANGDLDESFGFAQLPELNAVYDLARSPGGRLVGVGHAVVGSRGVDTKPQAFRFKPTGVLDRSFSADGIAGIPAAKLGDLYSLVLEPDGSILATGAGNATPYDQQGEPDEAGSDLLLVRIKRNGRPDRSFARRGVVLTDLGGNADGASALGVQPGGKIVLAGSRGDYSFRGDGNRRLVLARYTRGDGRIDSDGDGFIDARDRCRDLPGRGHRGCPVRVRRLSIGLRDNSALAGRLRSPRRRCVAGATVRIVRRHHGESKVIGADRDLRSGRYEVEIGPRAGKYHAEVKRELLRRVGICPPVRSDSLALNRR